ncbi:MAG TPA: ABC transporter ATP-binding protein [Acidimicrobiia bacterium]|nr:ABC transporter ATP-binding protein [Acidimicrobiia bacterium]
MAESPTVAVDRLKKAYGPNLAVDGLSFAVEPGEVFGLLGPNGAGKTSTVEMLEGYRKPDAGTALVLGLDPLRDHAALTPRIGVMLQEGGLYPGIRPLEALRLFAAYYEDHESPESLLDLVGLRPVAGTLVRRLSGGQKQRLSLALALVGKPEVVFLDEPTAGMDPHARLTTWEVVQGLKERGATVILTTHAMDEAERLCDRVAIIDGGHLVALGTPGDLTRSAGGGETRFTAAPGLDIESLAETLLLPLAAAAESKPGEYVIHAAPSPELVAALTAWLRDHGVALGDLRAGRRTLEEVFLQVTSEPSTAGGEDDEATVPGGRRRGRGRSRTRSRS